MASVKTGDESYGYSSGLADLDEMLGSAVMSEIFYRQGIPTERCLAVIGFPDGDGHRRPERAEFDQTGPHLSLS